MTVTTSEWKSLPPTEAVAWAQKLETAGEIPLQQRAVLLEGLDEILLEHVLAHVQEGAGDAGELRGAILAAHDLALRWAAATRRAARPNSAGQAPTAEAAAGPPDELASVPASAWADRWEYLLRVLRWAVGRPSLVADIALLGGAEQALTPASVRELREELPEGRPEQVFQAIAAHTEPLQPSAIAEQLGMNVPAVSRALSKLRDSGLVSFFKAGRHCYYSLTPRGHDRYTLLERLAQPHHGDTTPAPTVEPPNVVPRQEYWVQMAAE